MTPAPKGAISALTIAGDPRVTRVGAFLRRAKLNELPQLFNLLGAKCPLSVPAQKHSTFMFYYSQSQRAVMTGSDRA